MARNGKILDFEPDFLELSSVEFFPLCDQEGRAHTLANLALATFDRGMRIDRTNKTTYQPSWAPGYSSEVTYAPTTNKKESISLVRPFFIELCGPNRDLTLLNDGTTPLMLSSGFLIGFQSMPEKSLATDSHEHMEYSKKLLKLALESFFSPQNTDEVG